MLNEENTPLSESEVIDLEFIGWKLTKGIHKKQTALRVIKRFAAINKVIPVELIPYLNEACDYQIDNPGNTVSNDITASKWSDRVLDIEILRKCGDYKVKEACEAVVARDGSIYALSSLVSKRKGHPSKNPQYVDGYIEILVSEGHTLTDIVKFILGK